MKNKIALLLIIAMMGTTHPAAAYTTCKGGKEIVGAVNGIKFCASTGKMNWYSAVNWCKANGGEMASDSRVCPGTGYLQQCQNLVNRLSGSGTFITRDYIAYEVGDNFRSVMNRGTSTSKATKRHVICE